MAERVGFEPTNGFNRYSLSRRALSTSSATSPWLTFKEGLSGPFADRRGSKLVRATVSKKCTQHLRSFLFHHAALDRDAVVESRIIAHIEPRSGSAALG